MLFLNFRTMKLGVFLFKNLFWSIYSIPFQYRCSCLEFWKNFLIYLNKSTSGSSLHTSQSFCNTFHLLVFLCCIMGKLVSSLFYSSASSAATKFFSSKGQFLISELSSDWLLWLKRLFPHWSSPYLYCVTAPSMTDFLLTSFHSLLLLGSGYSYCWILCLWWGGKGGKFIPSGVG